MCGIAGFVGFSPGGEAERVESMLSQLIHRGPDAGDFQSGPGWALGARRLAIIDLVSGDQPVTNESGTVIAIQNGEIYNYRELRQELLARGHVLRSNGDTEVLVHLWEDHGPDVVKKLRGMFACAIFDSRSQTLFVARDRLGKKPLYWAKSADGVVFASELKALRKALPGNPAVDNRALGSYLRWGFVPENLCILEGVNKLRPGSYLLRGRDGSIEQKQYWQLRFAPDESLSFAAAQQIFIERLTEAVRLRLRADVPIAVFLSGGLDSAAVATLAAREGGAIRALTVSFQGGADELPLARQTAQKAGIEITPIQVEEKHGAQLLPSLAEIFDEPLADPSCIPTYLVAKAAREHCAVVLNGDGGDETLAGYRRFLATRLASLPGGRLWVRSAAHLAALGAHLGLVPASWGARMFAGLATADNYLAWGPVKLNLDETRRIRVDPVEDEGFIFEPADDSLDAINRMRQLELTFFLPGDLLVKMDRASMSCSLEARSPFLDQEVVEALAAIPTRHLLRGWQTKAVLRAAMSGVLPDSVLRAPKGGFEVPLTSWLSGEWRGFVREVLLDPSCAIRRYCTAQGLASWQEWSRHPDPVRASRAVYTLIVLEHWLRRWT